MPGVCPRNQARSWLLMVGGATIGVAAGEGPLSGAEACGVLLGSAGGGCVSGGCEWGGESQFIWWSSSGVCAGGGCWFGDL